MKTRNATAVWNGDLKQGNGQVSVESKAFDAAYSFRSRFEDGDGTNPEELIAAAHAGCYSMALSHMLSEAGYKPESVKTTAKVTLEPDDGGFTITKIKLVTQGNVPGIDEPTFLKFADDAKNGCPVSKALAGPEISLDATLQS